MPNWCENTLHVYCGKEDKDMLQKFVIRALDKTGKESPSLLCINNFIPLPDAEEENWYQWSLDNWGTKWDLECQLIEENNDLTLYTYEFNSAWSPPVEFVRTAAKLYPKLNFALEYYEPGIGFCGIYEAHYGGNDYQRIDDNDFETDIDLCTGCTECEVQHSCKHNDYCDQIELRVEELNKIPVGV